jgi:hypothetical protein
MVFATFQSRLQDFYGLGSKTMESLKLLSFRRVQLHSLHNLIEFFLSFILKVSFFFQTFGTKIHPRKIFPQMKTNSKTKMGQWYDFANIYAKKQAKLI